MHIAVALVLVPLVLWHIVAWRIRPRWSDLSRRTFLLAGSYQTGSFDPAAMPTMTWLVDPVPDIDPEWRLTVVDGSDGTS